MTTVRLEMNKQGIAELLRSEGVARAVRAPAEKVGARARSSAPVETGDYRDSIHVEDEVHRDRVVARVYADSDHAAAVESRTRNLGRALAGGGL